MPFDDVNPFKMIMSSNPDNNANAGTPPVPGMVEPAADSPRTGDGTVTFGEESADAKQAAKEEKPTQLAPPREDRTQTMERPTPAEKAAPKKAAKPKAKPAKKPMKKAAKPVRKSQGKKAAKKTVRKAAKAKPKKVAKKTARKPSKAMKRGAKKPTKKGARKGGKKAAAKRGKKGKKR